MSDGDKGEAAMTFRATGWMNTPRPHMPRPDPMSDATVEAVARAFCKRMGLDPDEGYSPYDHDSTPHWQRCASRAREAIAMHLAVQEVME